MTHLWLKSTPVIYFQSTLLFLHDKHIALPKHYIWPKSSFSYHQQLIYMYSTEQAGEAGQFYSQTAQKKKTFQVMFTLTDTVQEVHERQARHSIKAQKIPRSSDETCMIARPSATLQTVLFYMVSKVLPQRHNTQCEVQPKRGKKKTKLWSHFLQHSHSQCKQTSKLFLSLPLSCRLSWHCFEIMPDIEKDTHCCAVHTFYLSTPSVY